MKPAYSRPSSGPSDAGSSRPPIDYAPIWPANYGASRPAYHATSGTLDPLTRANLHTRGNSQISRGDTSLEGDPSDFMPLNTSKPSHAPQGKKLGTRRTAKQPHIGVSSDSDNSEEAMTDEEGDIVGDFEQDNYYSSNSKVPKVVNDYIENRFRRESNKKRCLGTTLSQAHQQLECHR